jgi:hypothetical protein
VSHFKYKDVIVLIYDDYDSCTLCSLALSLLACCGGVVSVCVKVTAFSVNLGGRWKQMMCEYSCREITVLHIL